MVVSHACWSGFLDLSAQTGVLPIPHEQRSFECHIDQLKALHYRQGWWLSNGFLVAEKQEVPSSGKSTNRGLQRRFRQQSLSETHSK
jgi:hypothetical protein